MPDDNATHAHARHGGDASCGRDLIVIGASAGGLPVLLELAAALPASFPASLLLVLHIGAHRSVLPELLARRGPLPAQHARSGETWRPGTWHVAPPDHHMLVTGDRIELNRGAKEHHARPAIDPLFRSAAIAHGPRVIGVVLSGRLDDGTAGLQAIKQCGGLAVIQDPADADYPSMPASARAHAAIDHCVPRAALAETLLTLVGTPASITADVPQPLLCEQRISLGSGDPMTDLNAIGIRSEFACPDCHGVLWEINDSSPKRYRCHTGHGFSLRTLEHTQAVTTDEALWSAIRALQEREFLLRTLARATQDASGDAEAPGLQARADEVARHWVQLQQLVTTVEEEQ